MGSRLNRPARLGFCFALLLSAVIVLAQDSQSGGITGVVKDPSGAVIRGATIEVYSTETGVLERRLTTNADGLYTAKLLRPGAYRLEVTEKGFGKYVATLAVRLNELDRRDARISSPISCVSVQMKGTRSPASTAINDWVIWLGLTAE